MLILFEKTCSTRMDVSTPTCMLLGTHHCSCRGGRFAHRNTLFISSTIHIDSLRHGFLVGKVFGGTFKRHSPETDPGKSLV